MWIDDLKLGERGVRFKTWLLLGTSVLAPVDCRADDYYVEEVPREHWSVSAVGQMSRWLGDKITLADAYDQKPITRYSMAVVTVRGLDKFGYNPASKDSIDGLAVRDVLAALVFEYGNEIRVLNGSNDGNAYEKYRIYKESHKHLTASEWYSHFQARSWTGVKYEDLTQSRLQNRVTPPPRLTITPQILQRVIPPVTPEQARIAREEALKRMWPQLPQGK